MSGGIATFVVITLVPVATPIDGNGTQFFLKVAVRHGSHPPRHSAFMRIHTKPQEPRPIVHNFSGWVISGYRQKRLAL
jgi:hypothetical protein